ncbi:hypothetical protein BOTBODRAFT_129750, partial [Botryobasidium botryosum FD-172 SS1]
MTDAHHHFVTGIGAVDPFAKPKPFLETAFHAILATALFRCWHIIIFFSAWATCITVICHSVHDVSVQSTLLTVWGTVLGFIVSYRTSSSFQRYDEGRKYWSSITFGCRMIVRLIWFHVPDTSAAGAIDGMPQDEQRARVLVEKKSAVNLVQAFAVAVKHYLRGEEGIYYEDLYHLLKHLPAYALPAGRPSMHEQEDSSEDGDTASPSPEKQSRSLDTSHSRLPYPVTTPGAPNAPASANRNAPLLSPNSAVRFSTDSRYQRPEKPDLLPSHCPPESSIFDVWPLSAVASLLIKKGKQVKGKKAARRHATRRVISHNLPLEITLYLSSYIAGLQERKGVDVPTANALIGNLASLVDSLTGLERILTTPIPFSYSIHLWSVTVIYLITLPFQLWKYLGWMTIPASSITAFIFFGFMVAGEEIENPFGYDKNDLNLDYFTENIIRQEILAVTAYPLPKITDWAFSPDNDLFGTPGPAQGGGEAVPPEEWVRRGVTEMRNVLERAGSTGLHRRHTKGE